jgi:mercuric ion transport protein
MARTSDPAMTPVGDTASSRTPVATPAAQPATRRFVAFGALGAVLASSCCIVPLALVSVGVTGVWIGQLSAVAPLQPVFAAVALVFLGLGFRKVYFQPKPACVDGSCARPVSGRVTKAVLWGATVLTLTALSIELWAPLVL